MPQYPSSVPFFRSYNGTSIRGPNNVLRSSMDVGPDKTRRRSSSGPRPYSGVIGYMTFGQFDQFESWFRDEIGSGALSFTAVNLFTGEVEEFRFVSPYSARGRGLGVTVRAQLEVLP